MATSTSASKKDQSTTRLFVLSLTVGTKGKGVKTSTLTCSTLLRMTEDLTRSVYPLPDLHVLLLVLDRRHGHCQLVNHLLQLVLVRCNGTGADENMLDCNSTHAWPSREQRGNHIHMDGVKCLCFFACQRCTLYWLVRVCPILLLFWKATVRMSK